MSRTVVTSPRAARRAAAAIAANAPASSWLRDGTAIEHHDGLGSRVSRAVVNRLAAAGGRAACCLHVVEGAAGPLTAASVVLLRAGTYLLCGDPGSDLGPTGEAEFAEDVLHVGLGGALADVGRGGDLPVGQAL